MIPIPMTFWASLGPETTNLLTSKQELNILMSGASQTGAITSVDTSLSVVLWNGAISNVLTDDADDNMYRIELTNATTVTVYRNQTANDTTPRVTVLEFNGDIVEATFSGTITLGSGSTSQVSTTHNAIKANCVALWLGSESQETSDVYAEAFNDLKVTGSDGSVTVTAARNSSGSILECGYALIEFKSVGVNSIQEVDVDISSTNTTATDTITAVDLDRSFILWGGHQTDNSAATFESAWGGLALTNSTTVTGTRGGSTGLCNINATVVELAHDLVSVEEISRTMTGTAKTQTFSLGTTLTDTSIAFVSFLGYHQNGITVDWNPNVDFTWIEILSTTQGQSEVDSGSGTGKDVTNYAEVIQT